MNGPLIRAENLSVGFPIGKGLFDKFVLKAVDDVTLHIDKGSFFGLVGESGSGKSTLGRSILQLVPTQEGTVTFDGTD